MTTETLSIGRKLASAVTQYDIKQSKRRGYNVYALSHYLGAVHEVEAELAKGADLRKALISNFNGRLLDVCLKACDLATSTREEQRGF